LGVLCLLLLINGVQFLVLERPPAWIWMQLSGRGDMVYVEAGPCLVHGAMNVGS